MPCLLLRRGLVCLPGDEGPEVARDPRGRTFDLFDVVDRLASQNRPVYVVDLDAVEGDPPQLDYLQEISRDAELWVDAGVRTAEQSIDVIVAGARRAVLSGGRIRGPEELRRAWSLSPEIMFEIEIGNGQLGPLAPGWPSRPDPVELARDVRAIGPREVVVSFREGLPVWELVRTIALGGPTWVGGTFDRSMAPDLAASSAAGGIYHIHEELARLGEEEGQE